MEDTMPQKPLADQPRTIEWVTAATMFALTACAADAVLPRWWIISGGFGDD